MIVCGFDVARACADPAYCAAYGCKRERDELAKSLPPRTTLTDGTQVYPGHQTIDPTTGLQQGYVVLSDEERAKGFVRPVRDAYRHDKCGGVTTMHRTLAETYARDPQFYGGTFCATCRAHFPVGPRGEFVWNDGSGQRVGT